MNEKTQLNMQIEDDEIMEALQKLNLADDFLFDVATVDLDVCKTILELSMNIKIREIRWKEGQKVVHNLPGKRGIRMDFYVEDETGKIYDVEMQKRNEGNIPKRTRFYQALMDAPLLKSGEKGFDNLNATCIVMICTFDLFGHGKYRYTFENQCKEVPGLNLGDESTKIILNTTVRMIQKQSNL
jgi:predicted transposase/invertase (TIGR01784 family)